MEKKIYNIIFIFKRNKIYKLLKCKYLIVFLYLFYFISIKSKDSLTNYSEIEKYIKFNLAGKLKHSPYQFYKRENPKISIVITTYNGQVYLKPILRSVQNQDFLNIEIIIVDDGSKDNCLEVIKELMKEDRRIKLLTNNVNRGLLYTIAKGVLNAKGKYVMTLDQDNLYATKNVFKKLYIEAEQNNLDLLGFSTIKTGVEIKDFNI